MEVTEQEIDVKITKRRFWRKPKTAKIALGKLIEVNYHAVQFTVQNGWSVDIRVQNDHLEVWRDSCKEIGLPKQYPIKNASRSYDYQRKYLDNVTVITDHKKLFMAKLLT